MKDTEKRMNLKFLVQLVKTSPQPLEILQQVYVHNNLSCTHVFEWHQKFKEGRVVEKFIND